MSNYYQSLQSWKDVDRILNKVAQDNEISSDTVFILFSKIRIFLEVMRISDLKNLKFIANVMLHDNLDRRDSLSPMIHLSKILKNPDENTIEQFGFKALNLQDVINELGILISKNNFSDKIFMSEKIFSELGAGILKNISRKNFDFSGRIYLSDGTRKENEVDKLGLRFGRFVIFSFETSYFITSSGLEGFGFHYKIDKGNNPHYVIIRGLLGVGRCLNCHSAQLQRFEIDNYALCNNCGIKHIIDKISYESSYDTEYYT